MFHLCLNLRPNLYIYSFQLMGSTTFIMGWHISGAGDQCGWWSYMLTSADIVLWSRVSFWHVASFFCSFNCFCCSLVLLPVETRTGGEEQGSPHRQLWMYHFRRNLKRSPMKGWDRESADDSCGSQETLKKKVKLDGMENKLEDNCDSRRWERDAGSALMILCFPAKQTPNLTQSQFQIFPYSVNRIHVIHVCSTTPSHMPDLPKAPYIVSFLALGGSWKSSKSLNRIIRKWSIVGKTKKACPFQKIRFWIWVTQVTEVWKHLAGMSGHGSA